MAEYVIGYDRQTHQFGSALIRVSFVRKGSTAPVRLRVSRYSVAPNDVIEVVPDESSTDTVVVLRARLRENVARNERVLDLLKAVTVTITGSPRTDDNAVVPPMTQTCTVRVDTTQRINECDELGARFERMIASRLRQHQQLKQGAEALQQAYANGAKADQAMRDLEWEHTQALGLLGGAAALSAVALGVVAVKAATLAKTLGAWAATYQGQGAWLVALAAGVAPEAAEQAGIQMLRAATVGATRNYARAATAAVGSGASAISADAIRRHLNAGLTEARAGMDAAKSMRQRLRDACVERQRALDRLQSEIDETRSMMKGCPGVELMPDPGLGTVFIPSEADWNVSRI
jgi:hypothetical protein